MVKTLESKYKFHITEVFTSFLNFVQNQKHCAHYN